MARTSNITKASKGKANTVTEGSVGKADAPKALVVPQIRKTKGNTELLAMIDKAIVGVRAMVQAVQRSEPLIAAAAQGCLEHFKKHGDMGPADRLKKGIEAVGHPAASASARELQAWFRGCSPIQWDLKGKVFKNKDETKGKIEVDQAKADEAAFFETKQAKAARVAMDRAHGNAMKAADLGFLIGRTAGVVKTLNNMLTGEDARKIKAGALEGMTDFVTDLNKVLKKFGGTKSVVPVVEVTKEQLAKVEETKETVKKAA